MIALEIKCEDILIAFFGVAKKITQRNEFAVEKADYEFQDLIHKLKANYPQLLEPFVFSNKGPLPYSPILDDSLENLRASGLLQRRSMHEPRNLMLTRSGERYFSERLEQALHLEYAGIEDLARDFLREAEVVKPA